MATYEQIRTFWASRAISSEEDLDDRLVNFRILFAYHSGRIENQDITYHDTREIFENGRVTGFTGDPRAIFEQRNQKRCYELLKERIVAREPMTLAFVKEVHRILTEGTYDEKRFLRRGERPGELKKHDFVTGLHEVGSTPGRVESDLVELLEEVVSAEGKDALKVATYFHARFESIHPFADGNGRVGRTLLNYYLMTHAEPPLVLYDEDKKRYYDALQSFDSEQRIDLLEALLRESTEKTWSRSFDRSE